MPRKSKKKPKITNERKKSDRNETDNTNLNESGNENEKDRKEGETNVVEKEKTGFCLSLDKKLKLQIKKQKKKEKKFEFETGKKKIPEEVSMIPKIEWESVENLKGVEEAKAILVVDHVVNFSEVEIINNANVILEMSEEEKNNLREFLKTLDIVDNRTGKRELTDKKEEKVDEKSRFQIETIPEDLFEEFLENEELLQTKEAIKCFPRTSPIHSPKSRRNDIIQTKSLQPSPFPSSSKTLYNYCGVLYEESMQETDMAEELKELRICKGLNRRLEAITEESSDFSDGSAHSCKKSKARQKNPNEKDDARRQPVAKETVQIIDGDKEVAFASAVSGGDSCSFQPVVVQAVKMSTDVVKIDLANSESEGEYEVNKSESSNEVSEIAIVNLENDMVRSEKENLKDDCSVKSMSSNSTKFLGDESESWRSSLNPDFWRPDGTEADVESELDSQKTFIFADADDDSSFKIFNFLDSNDVTSKSTARNLKNSSKTFETGLKHSWNSLNTSPVRETNDDFLFPKSNFLDNETIVWSQPVDFEFKKIAVSDDRKTDGPLQSSVSVKSMAKAMKNDMDKILLKKLKVMKTCEETCLSENLLANLHQNTPKHSDGVLTNCTEMISKTPFQNSNVSVCENTTKFGRNISSMKDNPEISKNPEALSNLAEKKVLTLPYGRLVLKKIGLDRCCSNDSESFKDFEEERYSKIGQKLHMATDSDLSIRDSFKRKVKKVEEEDFERVKEDPVFIEFDYSNSTLGKTEKWYGMRTKSPAVLVGLSPSQKKIFEEKQNKSFPNEMEAASLLDLHQKFRERRCYHEAKPCGKDKNVDDNSDSISLKIFITEICENNETTGKIDKILAESKGEVDQGKEKKFYSADKVDILPKISVAKLGNKNLKINGKIVKAMCYNEEKWKKAEEDGSKAEGKMKEAEGERNTQTDSVGNSRLLAILQNAISDEFAPELNSGRSISKSNSVNHEVPAVNSQLTMTDPRPKENKFSDKELSRKEDLVGIKTFQELWNKEKNYCSLKGESGGNKLRLNFRPKTICCEDETELYVNEPKFVKVVKTSDKVVNVIDKVQEKPANEEKEQLVITENLPTVSDVIKSFEEPKLRKPEKRQGNCEFNRKTQIKIQNERYQISKKGDVALIQTDPSGRRSAQKEKRKSVPVSFLSDQELFKQKMYDEYMSKLAERVERRQQKVIRVSQSKEIECPEDTRFFDIENEFINKVRERREKFSGEEDSKSRSRGLEELESLEKKCQEFTNFWEGEILNLEKEEVEGGSKRSSVRVELDPNCDVERLPEHLKELLQVEGEEFPEFLQDFQKVKGRKKLEECKRCKLRNRRTLLSEIDDELVLSKGFLFARGTFTENMPSSVVFSPTFKATAPRPGIWSPAQRVSEEKTEVREESEERKKLEDEPIPPVWTPKSTQASPVLEKKEFRPVNFESPTLPRKKYIQDQDKRESSVPPPWQQPGGDKPPELAKSLSSPALSLPRAPNPTVTLLQKAREGYLPRGAHYLHGDMSNSPPSEGAIHGLEILSSVKTESYLPRKIESGPKKSVAGIGPTTKEGIPLVLRSEVTEENKEKWYKRMYDSLHKYGKDDDFVTVKYRTSPSSKGLYGYHQGSSSGYQSEPESLSYDRTANKYVTLDRRRREKSKENECVVTLPRSRASPPRRDFTGYKNQPGRIEDYEPGHSSISELEANKWWDEVLEIFDRWLEGSPEAEDLARGRSVFHAEQFRREEEKSRPLRKIQSPRSFTNYASGYISDPQYVYKRSEDELQSPPSYEEQKEAYRIIQKGGEIPLKGLRKPAPERPKDFTEPEIEYFPLSPTLTRIRIHKQNITPLSELQLFPSYNTALNYPTVPFGVCSSYSQVQIFPPVFSSAFFSPKPSTVPSENPQKFSVQLQNISGSGNYVQFVPKPRNQPKKSPIYENVPVCKSCSPQSQSFLSDFSHSESAVQKENRAPFVSCKRNASEQGLRTAGLATFSDLKRVVPSILSSSIPKISLSKIPCKVQQPKSNIKSEKSKEAPKKRDFITPKVSKKLSTKTKENEFSKKIISKQEENQDKISKKKKILASKGEAGSKVKVAKEKVPLSESIQREKPLLKANKRLKNLPENLKKKKFEEKKAGEKEVEPSSIVNEDIIPYLSQFVECEVETSYVDLKTTEDIKSKVKVENSEFEEEATMSETPNSGIREKCRVATDMTEVFRSRSFSPETRKKIVKPPDMNKPLPPKRKQSKNGSTLKMWSKMTVSYPNHRSRMDAFDSNVKFLGDQIKKKLAGKNGIKTEFGDDVETVRTVKKDKNGTMSIKTNRYVRLSRPTLTSESLSSAYSDLERRRLFTKSSSFGSVSSLRSVSKPPSSEQKKSKSFRMKEVPKEEYLLRDTANQDEDKKNSLKVTVAISSKGKGLSKKSTGVPVFQKKTAMGKSSSSPCPSVSSYKSGLSSKSLLSDKGSIASDKSHFSPPRLLSPNSPVSRLSSPSNSTSSTSFVTKQKTTKSKVESKVTAKKPSARPVVATYDDSKKKRETKTAVASDKISKFLIPKISTALSKEELNKKYKETETNDSIVKKKESEILPQKGTQKRTIGEHKNEVIKGRDLVRTDSFFQNLFLGASSGVRTFEEAEKTSSVLELARMYQKRISWPETYKSEPSLSLMSFYLNQKRPVTFSKFKNMDRDWTSSRSFSPLGSFHSENFYLKLKRFDSMSQFGDGLLRDISPEGKERSSSEPPLRRLLNEKHERKSAKMSMSEASSMRSSPNSSRSPSCRRIQSFKSSLKPLEGFGEIRKYNSRARSSSELETIKSDGGSLSEELGKSVSSLNLSNSSDHTEYQAYLLELMHSKQKCERFRELHKFYSNLEKMGKLEKTASTGDLLPRIRSEEIIDFDRWKKIRTKERAEAELKALVENLMRVQKEKDLLFRTADVEAVRWKGDSGLRIKEKSVEDLKDQFTKYSQEGFELESQWKKESDGLKDHHKPLLRGSSIADVTSIFNNTLMSYRGKPITVEDWEKIQKLKTPRIGKEYGYSLKAWSSLSKEQVDALKDQLNQICALEVKKQNYEAVPGLFQENREVLVPDDGGIKSPGESSLHVRCNSALSKSQTYSPVIKRKEDLHKSWKKAESIGNINATELSGLPQLPWKDEETKLSRSHSESKNSKTDHHALARSQSISSSRALTENEKKKLSMSLSKEVIEKMTTASGQGPLFPKETLGALAVANEKLRVQTSDFVKKMSDNKSYFPVVFPPWGKKKWINTKDDSDRFSARAKVISVAELESGSGSSETSSKTVIRRNSTDVLKKVHYFEELQQTVDSSFDFESKGKSKSEAAREKKSKSEEKRSFKNSDVKTKKNKKSLVPSSSLENLNDFFGHQRQFATSPVQSKAKIKSAVSSGDTTNALCSVLPRFENFGSSKNFSEQDKSRFVRHRSASPPVSFRGYLSGSSNDSLFSYRSRSVSPDPTKYYRTYLKMVKCGAVRKLCNKFESWEDLLSLSSDRDFWLPPPPRRFASDPELTRDMLKRFGTDPTKVTIRGQEVGDVRWLKTKFEKNFCPSRSRSRFRRARSPLVRSPLTVADRYMPRINVISKTAELQAQGQQKEKTKTSPPGRINDFAGFPEGYKSLIDFTKDHGGYFYTGEVEKLRRKFERLEEAERLSLLGQMYTSTPDVSELRNIAPFLECSWVAHRHPEVTKTASPDIKGRQFENAKKNQSNARPHSSSPIRSKHPSSILKPSSAHFDRSAFSGQSFDPSIHRPTKRYQPEREIERRYKRGDPNFWRHWIKPTVTFKESVSFKSEPEFLEPRSDSPRKYVESEVTIHYKSPVRAEAKAALSEDELARRQAESMKRIYKEERRRKYLQELQDMNSRRHTDNFTPSQKSPISLNRYDDFPLDPSAFYPRARDYSTDPVLVARGLYDFVGRRPRELAFRRGDVIFIIRKLDKNWCEGELNGVVGLFPLSYVEVIPYNEINLKFGRARAKYDFVPQTPIELSARKGDMITLMRKIDDNWFEGRIGDRTGIIPASYCHVMAMPQPSRIPTRVDKPNKPVAAPAAHSLIHNGTGLTSKHYYTPQIGGMHSPGRSTTSSASANFQEMYQSPESLIDEALMHLDEEFDLKRSSSKSACQPLNVRINPRPEPALYEVLFNHVPNNDDELELVQGETVTVVEKCGDGWYIGSKTSDGKLGIFPGTHVRRLSQEFV